MAVQQFIIRDDIHRAQITEQSELIEVNGAVIFKWNRRRNGWLLTLDGSPENIECKIKGLGDLLK